MRKRYINPEVKKRRMKAWYEKNKERKLREQKRYYIKNDWKKEAELLKNSEELKNVILQLHAYKPSNSR